MAVGAAGLARWHINHISENSLNDVLSEITAAGPPGSLPEGPPGSPPGGPPSGILAEPPAGPPIPDDSELREFFDVLFRSAVLSDLVYLLTLPYCGSSFILLQHFDANAFTQANQMLGTGIVSPYNQFQEAALHSLCYCFLYRCSSTYKLFRKI